MNKNKIFGSFYTPKLVAEFLVDYIAEKIEVNQAISILEPSAGNGVFIKAISKNRNLKNKINKIVAVERDGNELTTLKNQISEAALTTINEDFLDFQKYNLEKFTLVIGNPPYIKKSLLSENQIELCKEIHKNANLSSNQIKNIWTAFLVRGIQYTDENGILAFVLPSELMQVKYAKELQDLIIQEFDRIEIFTFNELLFKDCKGQDTLLLVGIRKSKDKGIFYCSIENLSDLTDRKFKLEHNIEVKETKWTSYHLDPDEISLLENLRSKFQVINNYCFSQVGIVTAANKYFIVDSDILSQYSLGRYAKPIIMRGNFVNTGIDFTADNFQHLVDEHKPVYLISLNRNTSLRKNTKLWEYLGLGIEKKINEKYKTANRVRWYEVPVTQFIPDGFFFRRCNEYPKLVKNSANVYSTDTAYFIKMKPNYCIEDLIFSFYNSLTLAFAELNGRYYGGGVLELTPNEFKNLPIPYIKLSSDAFTKYVKEFNFSPSIQHICNRYDKMILKSLDPNLDDSSIEKIVGIRNKLYCRRVKTN